MKFPIGSSVRVMPGYVGHQAQVGLVGKVVATSGSTLYPVQVRFEGVDGSSLFAEHELEAVLFAKAEPVKLTKAAPKISATVVETIDRLEGEKPIDFFDRIVNVTTQTAGNAIAWVSRYGVMEVTGTETGIWHTLAHRSIRVYLLVIDVEL